MPITRGYFHFERSGSKLEITLSFFVCLQQHLLFLKPFLYTPAGKPSNIILFLYLTLPWNIYLLFCL